VIDASGMLLLPGGIDVHTHLDMPFGGTTSSDDFETGTRAAAFGGTTTLIDFAIQARGMKMRDALDIWWKKAENRASIDYGLHMIVTDLYEAGLEDMDAMVAEGVASFKLFMAYPGVLMVDDATIFKALSQSARNGALICMHAENGGVIDVIVRRALAEGKTAPIYHALTRPATAEAEAVHRAIALAEMAGAPVYIVHLSSEDALEPGARGPRPRPAGVRGNLPAVLLLSVDDLARPGFEGAKYVFTPPLREKRHQPKLWDGLKNDHSASGLHGPLSILFRRPEVAGQRRFHQDSQWRAGHRESPAASLSLRRERGPPELEPVRGTGVDHSGAAVRPLSAQRRTGARAATPTSSCGTRNRSTSSAPPRITCAWITRCSKASA
jgi:dihydroorotase-like cyclic amidohydrolase